MAKSNETIMKLGKDVVSQEYQKRMEEKLKTLRKDPQKRGMGVIPTPEEIARLDATMERLKKGKKNEYTFGCNDDRIDFTQLEKMLRESKAKEEEITKALEEELLKKTKEERKDLFDRLEEKRDIHDLLNGTTHEKNAPPTKEESVWMLEEIGVDILKKLSMDDQKTGIDIPVMPPVVPKPYIPETLKDAKDWGFAKQPKNWPNQSVSDYFKNKYGLDFDGALISPQPNKTLSVAMRRKGAEK
ncbi:MAG: hypothetical protein J6P93_00800 [Alphaproteobacteria bacterium]|nr:hypothetical protein [Alphaproteobacteria bacterium]